MKHLKIVFGLVVVTGLMAVSASSAVAAPRWVTCLELLSNTGKWTNNLCTTPSATGDWETSEVKETIEVTSSGALELEDEKAPGGATRIKCEGTDEGTIGAGGSDSTKEIKATECKFVGGKHGSCEEGTGKKLTAEPRNLGWTTQLKEEGTTEVRDEITSLVSGKSPGWIVKCTVAGIFEATDECTANTTVKVIPPNETKDEKGFEAEFESKGAKAKCTASDAVTGNVAGRVRFSVYRNGILRRAWVLANIPGFPR